MFSKQQIVKTRFFFLFAIMVALSACTRDPTKAVVIVKDISGSTVTSANIVVSCMPGPTHSSCVIDVKNPDLGDRLTGTSDIFGEFELEFEAPKVLRVEAAKANLSGTAFLTVEEGKTVTQVVVIAPTTI